MDFLSLGITVVVGIATVIGTYYARRSLIENRLQNEPNLQGSIAINKTSDRNGYNYVTTYALRNTGMGTAEFKSISWYLATGSVNGNHLQEPLIELTKNHLALGGDCLVEHLDIPANGFNMAPGDNLELFRIHSNNTFISIGILDSGIRLKIQYTAIKDKEVKTFEQKIPSAPD